MSLFIIIFCSFIAYLLTRYQSRKIIGLGSDHVVHLFLINNIRNNGNHLFEKVPGIINEAYLGALPLFMHYVLSFFDKAFITVFSKHYNSVVNSIFVLLGGAVSLIFVSDISNELLVVICLVLALCPQFFHAFSARNFGISSRPLGLLLVSILVIVAYLESINSGGLWYWCLGVLVGYLIWGTNTFALQTVVFTGSVEAIIYDHWFYIAVTIMSMFLFLLLNKGYARSYIYRTYLFIYTYATQIAKLYTLKQRYSIWRDLIWDFYKVLSKSKLKDSIKYIYLNSIVIVFLLNPFIFVSLIPEKFLIDSVISSDFLLYCRQFSFCCFLVFILTSFRYTRFLGEPERYIEMATLFAVIPSVVFVFELYGIYGLISIVSYCILFYFIQIVIINKLSDHVELQKSAIDLFENQINEMSKLNDEHVVFYSNNEDITKKLMSNDWSFARFWSFDTKFVGCKFEESYTQFPYYNEYLTKSVIDTYRLNYVLFDKNNFHFIPQHEHLSKVDTIMESDDMVLFRLSWVSYT